MSDGSIVKRVIIQTEIEAVNKSRSNASGASGGRSMSSVDQAKRTTKEKQKQVSLDSRANAETLKVMNVRRNFIKHERQWERQKLQIRDRSAKLERERIAKETRAALWLEKTKKNSLKLERDRTAEIIKQARMQDSFMSSPRAQRVRREAERRLAYRQGTGQAENIGARNGGTDSRSVNPFSTGIDSLDNFNAKGFQLFITVMSAKMVFDTARVALGNTSGALTGRGDSLAAQGRRFWDTGEVSEDGWVKSAGDFGGGVLEGAARLLNYGVFQGRLGGAIDQSLQRGAFTMDTRSAASRAIPAAQSRLIAARQGMEDVNTQFPHIKELRELHEQQVQEERALLAERRAAAVEEKSYLMQRTALARSEVDRAIGERDNATVAFGKMNVVGKNRARFLQNYIGRGGDIGQLPRELQEVFNSSALFRKESRESAISNAFNSGFVQDFGQKYKDRITQKQRDLNIYRRDMLDNDEDIRNIEAKIENLNFEVKYEGLAEQFKDSLDQAMERLKQELLRQAEEQAERVRQDDKRGKGP